MNIYDKIMIFNILIERNNLEIMIFKIIKIKKYFVLILAFYSKFILALFY